MIKHHFIIKAKKITFGNKAKIIVELKGAPS
jgi:hypothetical protein